MKYPPPCIRVAQNLEVLEKFTSLGGSIFHLGYIKNESFIYFCYPPATPQISPYDSMHYHSAWGISRPSLGGLQNLEFFLSITQKGKWIHPGKLTSSKFPNSEPRYPALILFPHHISQSMAFSSIPSN